jgi:hypothetical protein
MNVNNRIAKPIKAKLPYNKIIGSAKKPVHSNIIETAVNSPDQDKSIKCIDLNFLKRRTKLNPELMMGMISQYLEQTPLLITAMKQSFHDNDWNSLYSALDKMIPSFSIVGISIEVEIMARKVQNYANTRHQPDGVTGMVLQLEHICSQACVELEQEVNMIKIRIHD